MTLEIPLLCLMPLCFVAAGLIHPALVTLIHPNISRMVIVSIGLFSLFLLVPTALYLFIPEIDAPFTSTLNLKIVPLIFSANRISSMLCVLLIVGGITVILLSKPRAFIRRSQYYLVVIGILMIAILSDNAIFSIAAFSITDVAIFWPLFFVSATNPSPLNSTLSYAGISQRPIFSHLGMNSRVRPENDRGVNTVGQLFMWHRIADLLLLTGALLGHEWLIATGIIIRYSFVITLKPTELLLEGMTFNFRAFYFFIIFCASITLVNKFDISYIVLWITFISIMIYFISHWFDLKIYTFTGLITDIVHNAFFEIANLIRLFFDTVIWTVLLHGISTRLPAFFIACIKIPMRIEHNGNVQRSFTIVLICTIVFLAYYVGL